MVVMVRTILFWWDHLEPDEAFGPKRRQNWNFHQELKCLSGPVNFLKSREQRGTKLMLLPDLHNRYEHSSEHSSRHFKGWMQGHGLCHVMGPKIPRLFLPREWTRFSWQKWKPFRANLDHWVCGGKEAGLRAGRPGIRTAATSPNQSSAVNHIWMNWILKFWDIDAKKFSLPIHIILYFPFL